MAEDSVDIGRDGPKWKVDRVISRPSNRAKEILVVNDQRGTTPSFVAKVATAPFSASYLQREFHFLTILGDTGFTPYPQMFKKDEEAGEARLMLEHIPGMSIEDRLKDHEDLPMGTLPDVVESALNGIEAVHAKGVLVVDINKGTFMISDDGKSVKIVDFELAHDQGDLLDSGVNWYLRGTFESADRGLQLAASDSDFQFNADVAKTSEKYRTAALLLKYYMRNTTNPSTNQFREFDYERLNHVDKALFEERKSMLLPKIKRIVDIEHPDYDDERKEKMGAWMLSDASMDIVLPYILQDNGVNLEQGLFNRIKKSLSPILSERT